MTEESRQNAYAKIRNVARNVAWPSWIFNDAALADHYKMLNIRITDDVFTINNKVSRDFLESLRHSPSTGWPLGCLEGVLASRQAG